MPRTRNRSVSPASTGANIGANIGASPNGNAGAKACAKGSPKGGPGASATPALPLAARQLLRRLGRGGRLLPHGPAYRLGASPIAARLVATLRSHDLVEPDPAAAGGFRLSQPGRVWLERDGQPVADALWVQNRLIAQARRMIDGVEQPVSVNLAVDPLVWLHRRGLLGQRQCDAAAQLRADFEQAQLAPRVTMQWDAPPRTAGARGAPAALLPGEAQSAAQRRFAAAIAAVGQGQADLLWRVVCHHEGLESAERAYAWPQRTAKVVLGLALDLLADHYRLPRPSADAAGTEEEKTY